MPVLRCLAGILLLLYVGCPLYAAAEPNHRPRSSHSSSKSGQSRTSGTQRHTKSGFDTYSARTAAHPTGSTAKAGSAAKTASIPKKSATVPRPATATIHTHGRAATGRTATHSPLHATASTTASGVKRDAHGHIARSEAAKDAFMRKMGYPHGRPGYVVDHIVPLACGGRDDPSNMQWQTVEAAKAKDKVERKGCGK